MTILAAAPTAPQRPLFRADWREALFIHFRFDPAGLRARVPLDLDLFEGRAYLSLVAFTQANLRPCVGGAWSAWLSRPLATHEFLNLRTYVRRGSESGIYFLSEWIPNRLATLLGPRLYGLPYQLGRLSYATNPNGEVSRDVECRDERFTCAARIDRNVAAQPCAPDSEAAFLLERYVAFTCRAGVLRRFRIRHQPWMHVPADVAITRHDLLGDWAGDAPSCAHFSRGVTDVMIGRPERLRGA